MHCCKKYLSVVISIQAVKIMNLKLDKNTEYIIKNLEDNGFEAYAVGGCVRDMLMDREVNDFDITTSALPEEIKKIFSSHTVIETGIKHGTVTILIHRQPYEVTTFRTEASYTDSRHPDSVKFVRDLTEDLARRDFTMNAIAYSTSKGIIDPFNGLTDIKNKTIRAVGNPFVRFQEDALRILRGIRFSSVLGFEIEEETKQGIFSLAPNIKKVSSERIYIELKKLILGKTAQETIKDYYPIISQIISINGDYKLINRLPLDYRMRFSCLCGDSVTDALNYLKADNETKNLCEILVTSTTIPKDIPQLKNYISVLGEENALFVSNYRRCLYNEDRENLIQKIISSGEPIFLKDLAINGKDLIKIGIKGEEIGKTLKHLLNLVHIDKTLNTKEKLIEKAKQ